MDRKKQKPVSEELQRLVNKNYKSNEVITITYKSKTEESLLIEKK